MASMQPIKSKWETAKPLVFAFAVGLITGPLVSNYIGWQVTSRAAQADMRAGIVEQQALFCEARARVDVPAPDKLGWDARYELAGGCTRARQAWLGCAVRIGKEMVDHAGRHRAAIGRGERLCEQARGVSAAQSGGDA